MFKFVDSWSLVYTRGWVVADRVGDFFSLGCVCSVQKAKQPVTGFEPATVHLDTAHRIRRPTTTPPTYGKITTKTVSETNGMKELIGLGQASQ